MAQVELQERRHFHASESVELREGETQITISLPEPVPAGKVLKLRVEISGSYQDDTSQG